MAKFLHGKAYLFGDKADARVALVTSANLTAAGMWQNLELGLVHYDPEVSRRAIRWFDELWDQATPYKDDLHDFLFPDVDLLDPRTVYLRALLELFGDVLDDEGTPPEAVKLAPFQEDGFRRALGIVDRHRGVVYADGVGAGKTFVGMAFVEEPVGPLPHGPGLRPPRPGLRDARRLRFAVGVPAPACTGSGGRAGVG